MICVCGRAAFSANPTDEPMSPVPRIATRLYATNQHPQKTQNELGASPEVQTQIALSLWQKQHDQQDKWSVAQQRQQCELEWAWRKAEDHAESVERRNWQQVEQGQKDVDLHQ